MTASPAASRPASGIQAATCPGLWPGVGTTSAVRPPSSRRSSGRPASAPANGAPGAVARALGRGARRTARRRARRSARSARGSCARGRRRAAGRARRRARARRACAASSSAVPPRWSLSGCVMSTASSRSPSRATSGSSSAAATPGRPVSTTQHRLVAGDHDLAHDARAVVLLAAPDALGELADHRGRLEGVEQAADDGGAIARPADDMQRAGPAETREVGEVERLEGGERKRHRRDRRALDEQLLEALGEGPAGGARDALVERRPRAGRSGRTPPGPRSRCASR